MPKNVWWVILMIRGKVFCGKNRQNPKESTYNFGLIANDDLSKRDQQDIKDEFLRKKGDM